MLGWRLAISAILIPVLITVFVFDHRTGAAAYYLLVLCLLLAARGVYEMTCLLRSETAVPSKWLTGVCALTIVLSGWSTHWEPSAASGMRASLEALGPAALVFSLSVLVLFLKGALVYREPGRSMPTLGAELLIVSYVGVLLCVTAQLRWVAGAQAGYLALGSLVIAAKSGDIGAYTLGRMFGKRKMVPRLSPGKTWMGAIGAVLGAGVGSVTWLRIAPPFFGFGWQPCDWFWSAAFGMTIGVVGLLGDLCESLIKRDVGKKDSADLLPGFGGLLDLLDSVLYAGPIAYLLWLVFPLATWT